jgi:hypothetical protein
MLEIPNLEKGYPPWCVGRQRVSFKQMQPKLSIGWRAVNHNLEDEGLPPLLDCVGVLIIEYSRVGVSNGRLKYLPRSTGRERRVFGEI